MTNAALQTYYNKNKHLYADWARSCSSISEILLRIVIYGKTWSQWDWIMLFFYILQYVNVEDSDTDKNTDTRIFFDDIINTIDTTSDLDAVIKNKQFIMSMLRFVEYVGATNGFYIQQNAATQAGIICMDEYCVNSNYVIKHMNCILAHIFNKFPNLLTMSWMYIKHNQKVIAKKGITRSHRLVNVFACDILITHSKSALEKMNIQTLFENFKHRYFYINSIKHK